MTEIERYRPNRLSRARLREWLDEFGPQPLSAVLVRAQMEVPDLDEAQLLAELADHPALFRHDGRGRWAAVEPKAYVPRPRSAWQKKAPARAARQRFTPPTRYQRPAPPPPPESGVDIQDGRLRAVVVPEDAPAVGDRLIADLPVDERSRQEIEAAGPDLADGRPQVQVFQQIGGEVVFRGVRPALGARELESGRLRVVLGRAEDDRAPALALPSARAHLAGRPSTALVPYRPGEYFFADLPELDESVSKALLPAIPAAAAAPNVLAELKRQLQGVQAGSVAWSDFTNWLGTNLKRLDVGQRERCSVLVAATTRIPAADRMPVVQHLVSPEEATPTVAISLVEELAEGLSADGSLARWALPLVATTMASDPDGPVMIRAGRICWNAGAYDQAFACFVEALDVGQQLDPDDLVLCGLSAQEVGEIALVEKLCERTLRACTGQAPLAIDPNVISSLVHQLTTLIRGGRLRADWAASVLELRVARNEVDLALQEAEGMLVWDERLGVEDRVRAILSLDACEKKSDLEKVCDLASKPLWLMYSDLTDRSFEACIGLLRFAEEIAGVPGKHSQPITLARAPGSAPTQTSTGNRSQSEPDLAGVRIALIGGLGTARRRIVDKLESWGATVREVAPSWEGKVSESNVRSACTNANLVVEMTSAMKHDASEILDNLAPNLSFERRRVWGGATRALQVVADWARALGSIRPAR